MEWGYAAARPAFCQTSARAALACASVGVAADAQASKADMAPAEAKTTECVSAAQPETVIFCEAFALFASP